LKFTIATATYNRADVLHRVYESLNAQTNQDFEWIIVDDGSSDHTADLVQKWIQESAYPIHYFYQENSGKHMAVNAAVEHAKGEFFVIADSDDTFKPEALEVLLNYWEQIPEKDRHEFRGVTCRCYDVLNGTPIGTEFEGGVHDILGIESAFKYPYQFEMWGINRTDVMREFPFPDTRGQGLAFYPESIIWHRMGLKYKVRFVNDPLRAYYRDQKNATTAKKRNRSKENIHLWTHYLNDLLGFFWYRPMAFVKAAIGLSMDGLLLHQSFGEIMSTPNSFMGKLLVFVLFPVGFALYLKRK